MLFGMHLSLCSYNSNTEGWTEEMQQRENQEPRQMNTMGLNDLDDECPYVDSVSLQLQENL